MNKKVVSLLLAGGMVVSMAGQLPQSIIPSYYVSAEQGETDGFAYQTLADGTLRLTGYTGETSEVTVPSQIGGVSVTVIGEGLFKANRTMTSVIIPEGITKIENSAFENCLLTSVKLPTTLTKLGANAFYNCAKLETAGLPRTVTTIGERAFHGTKWIETLKKTANMAVVNDRLIEVSDTTTERLAVPSTVKIIGEGAFYNNSRLNEITLPATTEAICADAFKNCTALKSIVIPGGVTKIGEHAFGYTFANDTYKKIDGFKIFGNSGSAAQAYASENGFEFAAVDALPARVYGSDRYGTSMAIADQLRAANGGKKFSSVIIASGLNFADALSAAYLAKVKNAPILLTSEAATDRIANYIKDSAYANATVYIVGGQAAVPASTEKALGGFKTFRLAGPNRYITNLLVLKEAGVTNQEILIASGTNYADALSASAVGKPVMLASGISLLGDQISYLKTLSSKTATIIGGTGAVGAQVETQAKSIFAAVARIGGSDRYETSANVASKYFDKAEKLTLAYALNYPDGLCAGPLAAKYSSPLILTASSNFVAAKDYATKSGSTSATTIGGKTLISDEAVRAILNTGISATCTTGSITLSWKAAAGAVSYEIYNVTGTKTRLGTSTTTSFKIGCRAGTTYKFEVVPVNAAGTKLTGSAMFIITGTDPLAVTNLKSGIISANYAQLKWDDTNHSYYQVYRKTTGGFALVGTTSTNSFTDSTVSGSTTYEYMVRAVFIDGSGKAHIGADSNTVKVTTITATPSFTEPTSDTNYITLRWSKIDGITTYYVSIYKDGKWQTYSTTNNYYVFSNLTRSTAYQFSLYGVKTVGGTTYRTGTANCTLSTDSTVKSKSAFKIYSAPNTNSAVLYSGSAGMVLDKKGSFTSSWYKVYIPGSNKQNFGYIPASQVGGYVDLDFGPINQLGWEGGAPMPTGCETTALATLLNRHLGFTSCTKNLLADKFLTIVNYWVGDPNYASWGSPYDDNAYGVMAPALAETANRYLKSVGVRDQYQIDVHTDNDANMSWYKLDTGSINHSAGLDLEGLKKEREKGHAVQIWWITRGEDPSSYATFTIQRGQRYSHDGTGTYSFTWVGTQHGSVISGYDETTGEFIIADVGWGFTVRHSITHFMKIYGAQGRQSIVIYKK